MSKPAITVITASCRPDGLPMVGNCLERQTFRDWEWLIVMPESKIKHVRVHAPRTKVLMEPPKREGDFYRLNGAWNVGIQAAKADLIVFICDWIWFEPDALQRFADHFANRPNVGVNSIGDHYRVVVRGRPEILWQAETRMRQLAEVEPGVWEGCPPYLWENACCSMPRQGLLDVGGFDEEYDRVAGNSEKDAAYRMYQKGCRFQIDPSIVIRNFTHKKECTPTEWDAAYSASCQLWTRRQEEIGRGESRMANMKG